MKQKMRLGIIGGGLMGREAASAFGRWFVLNDFPVQAELVAVCDLQENLLEWFRQVPTVKLVTKDYQELLRSADVDVVYVAVPHNLHEKMYLDVLAAGKDLLAEKPFGIDLTAARNIAEAARKSGRFVRCSSEFPFLPGPQRVVQEVQSGKLGKILEIRSGFWHSSDLDPTKPVNWKRQVKTCGEIGVMGDLGM
ncbi:MAG: putative GFO/IDH/MocA family oxidoreductase, partial [Verrucomicrobiales bacterium]|nr:putative GFO/IDH/MocA family oxidoreductase [Verrucomicrobiales bacterium]